MTASENQSRSVPEMSAPPAGYFLVVPPKDDEDDDSIDPAKIVRALRENWMLLVALTFLGGATGAGISLTMRNLYKSQAVIAPTAENNSGNSLKDEMGGIAELAGVDLGGQGGRKVEAFATLSAPGFIRDFIVKNDLIPLLFDEKWDTNTRTWKSGVKPPTLEQAVKKFKDARTINENSKSGLISIYMEWYTPELAAKWTNEQIDLVNERMRAADIRTAEMSLDYLNHALATANTVELRLAVSHLIEKQINNEMMANVQRDYAYHFIDHAVPPEMKDSPRRTLISIGGAVIGLVLGCAWLTLKRRYTRVRRTA